MKQLKAIFGLFVVVATCYVAWKVLPVYYTNYEFQDFIETQARIDSYTPRSEDDVAETVLQRAKELELPVALEQIHVQKGGGTLSISAEYSVHVDLPLRPLDLVMKAETKNRRI